MNDSNHTFKEKLIFGIAGSVIFLLIWTGAGYLLTIHPDFQHFAGFHPKATFKALYHLLFDDLFWNSVLASLNRIIVGLCFSLVLGIPIGMLIGFYKLIWQITYFPIQFLRMISPLSWMPIAILVFASFDSSIYFLITVACVWPILLNTAQGVNRVNKDFINMAINQGATDWQLLTKIILPSALPYMIIGLRLALGIAWVILVPAEFLGVSSGLGYSINDARDTLEYDRLLAIVFAIGCLGLMLDSLVQFVEKRCYLKFMAKPG
ncbi:MAG: ABC transporter permease [Deltaproteobacteria bacterium]|jgi:NitT/TauT family transport system permease protein|nr:ABC transporter permease [Deltaproteobacteria bacterium]MBT4525464.1 ABC transporter permease [Deltaproteobacteria bacterium]